MQKQLAQLKSSGAKVYSYVRFSSGKQALKDSYRRQWEETKKFCKKYQLQLDDTLRIEDLGVSAYTGKNVLEGELSKFKLGIESGDIPTPAILIVEAVDRISRLPPEDSIHFFTTLTRLGLTIITLIDKQIYNSQSMIDNPMLLMGTIMHMNLAHSESFNKSLRVGKSWHNKAKNLHKSNVIYTRMLPMWLTVKNDEIVPIPDRAEIVNLIFQKYLDGLGMTLIAKHLNKNGYRAFKNGKEWGTSSIQKILSSRRTIGCFFPKGAKHEISNYYPEVVPINIFEKVQVRLKAKLKKIGDKGVGGQKVGVGKTVNNIFIGIGECGYCGGSMGFTDRGSDYRALVCNTHKSGKGCQHNATIYETFEHEILMEIIVCNQNGMFDAEDVDVKDNTEIILKRDKAQNKLNGLKRLMDDADTISMTLIEQVAKIDDEIKNLNAQIIQSSHVVKEKNYFTEVKNFYKLKDSFDGRMKLKSELQFLIKKIVIKNTGTRGSKTCHAQIIFRNSKSKKIKFKYKKPDHKESDSLNSWFE